MFTSGRQMDTFLAEFEQLAKELANELDHPFPDISNLTLRLHTLGALLASQSNDIPAYHRARAAKTLAKLSSLLDTKRSELFPNKFRFSSLPKLAAKVPLEDAVKSEKPVLPIQESTVVIRDKTFANLSYRLTGEDVCLDNLDHCIVSLTGKISAVRIYNLRNCSLIVSAVSGAAHIDSVKSSVISLAALQIRVHNTYDSNLYVFAKSGPIIEDCKRLAFAPINIKYPEFVQDMENAGMDPQDTVNHWNEVRDFKWLKSMHSPNWSIIPLDTRSLAHVPEIEGTLYSNS